MTDLKFSPDGQQLVSYGDYDTEIGNDLVITNINPQAWQNSACDIVNRNFTLDEWNKFANGEAYFKVCPRLPVHETLIRQMLVQARSAAGSGDKNTASADYSRATQWVLATNNPILADYICWYGSLDQFATEVLPACKHAVELEPGNGLYRDRCALARTLLGDYQGAIAAFTYFVTWATGNSLYTNRPYIAERNRWIQELKAGRNPFDTRTLKALQSE